jgi:DNA polymerase-3 subunit alpha
MWSYAADVRKDQNLGILNLFSLIEEPVKPFMDPPAVVNPSSKEQLLQKEKEFLGFYLSGHPMDDLTQRMRQLSCVPLSEIPKLPDQAIIRVAFIIDAIQNKVSSKTQKKFAILTISDGIEKFELPIWAEMYEAKLEILKENQICYALLLVENKDRSTQLSCKFLDVFSSIDEQKMQACDTLYDQTKMHQRAKEGRWKKEKEKEKEKPAVTEKELTNLTISLNADAVCLSHILQLKDLFREHPGSCALELHWMSGTQRVGAISIDQKWGVKADKGFQEKLDTFLKKHQIQ